MTIAVRSEATPSEPGAFAAAVRNTIAGGKALRLQLGDDVCEIQGDLALAIINLLEAVSDGQSVEISQLPDQLTTGQAADLLGVTRPTVVALIDAGKLPATRVGTHRRLKSSDVIAYRRSSRDERRSGLDEVIEASRALGLYDE